MKESALGKLIRLCMSITNDESLLTEFEKEIEQNKNYPALKTMIASQIKSTNIISLGFDPSILSIFFYPKTITEIDLYSAPTLGIKCFFMSKGTIFPIHDHPNRVIVTGVLHGTIKYLSLNKTDDPEVMTQVNKGTGRKGKIMFSSLYNQNVHSILALENSIIIDIFMHNVNDMGCYYKVIKKIGKKYIVAVNHHVHFLTRSFKSFDCDCTKNDYLQF
ncbi:hypothetical protein SteCoe_24486 [Stentor coeruleus]|uniref:Cysteine dioxygenase n=1 Tax=Stentor coeruleus TaxID=5963 RepID=A0A1R2BHH2_9CILI|nr:hypothetical protein SteCoe_24486 [Stentor coeruleus]